MRPSILIPCVTRDERIGGAFNHLFQVIHKTENINEDIEWDFNHVTFFHPFYLVSLAIYRKTCQKDIAICNLSRNMKAYFDAVLLPRII